MSSEAKIKVEPGTYSDVAGSVGGESNVRSASQERRMFEAEEEPKVKAEREAGERAVERALSFSSEETEAEELIPPNLKRISKRVEAKNAKMAKRAAARIAAERQARLDLGSRADHEPDHGPDDEAAPEAVPSADQNAKKPYQPDPVLPYAATNSSLIIWNAGQLAVLARTRKILKPLKIRLPQRLWGPVPKPEFENITGKDRDLAMSFTVHTLLCGGLVVKEEDLPVTEDSALYYHQFVFENLCSAGVAVFNALANLVGSVLLNFTPRTPNSQAGSDLGSVTERLRKISIQDPCTTPVRSTIEEVDVVMESVQRHPAPELRIQAIRAVHRTMLPGHALISTKSKEKVEREKLEKRKAKPKASKKMKRHGSASDTDEGSADLYGDVYFGRENDDDEDHALRIRAASTVEIKSYLGREMNPERATNFRNRLSRKGRRDRLSSAEMRDLFADHLLGGAKNWYQQLPRVITRSWQSIVEAFKFQYCDIDIKPAEQYYSMIWCADELPIEHFNRLNLAAHKAKVSIRHRRENERAHVLRFMRSVDDEDLARSLSLQRIRAADDLGDALVELSRHTHWSFGRDRARDTKTPVDKARSQQKSQYFAKKPAPELGSKDKPLPVKSIRWVLKIAVVNPSDQSSGSEDGEDRDESRRISIG